MFPPYPDATMHVAARACLAAPPPAPLVVLWRTLLHRGLHLPHRHVHTCTVIEDGSEGVAWMGEESNPNAYSKMVGSDVVRCGTITPRLHCALPPFECAHLRWRARIMP